MMRAAVEERGEEQGSVEVGVEVEVEVAAAGYRASKLIGKTVLNDTGEKVGTLDDIILGTDYKANYAIIEVGGFLGIGAHLVAVPFESLKIEMASGKIALPGASKTALEKLAEFKYLWRRMPNPAPK